MGAMDKFRPVANRQNACAARWPDDIDPVLYLAELDCDDNVPVAAVFDSRLKTIIGAAHKQQLYGILDSACEAALNGKAAAEIRKQLDAELWEFDREAEADQPRNNFTFGDLRREYPHLNPPVVDGLFREAETVNESQFPKFGKSWLAYNLALSIITGQRCSGGSRRQPAKCYCSTMSCIVVRSPIASRPLPSA